MWEVGGWPKTGERQCFATLPLSRLRHAIVLYQLTHPAYSLLRKLGISSACLTYTWFRPTLPQLLVRAVVALSACITFVDVGIVRINVRIVTIGRAASFP